MDADYEINRRNARISELENSVEYYKQMAEGFRDAYDEDHKRVRELEPLLQEALVMIWKMDEWNQAVLSITGSVPESGFHEAKGLRERIETALEKKE